MCARNCKLMILSMKKPFESMLLMIKIFTSFLLNIKLFLDMFKKDNVTNKNHFQSL